MSPGGERQAAPDVAGPAATGGPPDGARPARAWTAANAFMAAVFGLAALVQVNDPDPAGWMALYGLAAAACVLALLGRGHRWLPALLAAASVLWAATLAPSVVQKVPFLDMFGAWEMADAGIEASREMYGLLLVAAWMILLAARGRPDAAGRTSARGGSRPDAEPPPS